MSWIGNCVMVAERYRLVTLRREYKQCGDPAIREWQKKKKKDLTSKEN